MYPPHALGNISKNNNEIHFGSGFCVLATPRNARVNFRVEYLARGMNRCWLEHKQSDYALCCSHVAFHNETHLRFTCHNPSLWIRVMYTFDCLPYPTIMCNHGSFPRCLIGCLHRCCTNRLFRFILFHH